MATGRATLGMFDTKGVDVAMCAESFRRVPGKLDLREEHFRIPSHHHGRSLFLVTGRFTGRCPELVVRLVFFGPIAQREPSNQRIRLPGWRPISLADQWNRFTETVPPGEPPVLLRRHFDEWGECYLDIDPESRTRSPAAVKVPSGAFQDIYDAWTGEACLRSRPCASTCFDHSRRVGRDVRRPGRALAFRRAQRFADPARR